MSFYRDVTSSVLLFLPIIITSRLYRIYEHENQRSQMYPLNFTCVMQNRAEVENVQGNVPFKQSLFANERLFCMFALLCCKVWRKEQNRTFKSLKMYVWGVALTEWSFHIGQQLPWQVSLSQFVSFSSSLLIRCFIHGLFLHEIRDHYISLFINPDSTPKTPVPVSKGRA